MSENHDIVDGYFSKIILMIVILLIMFVCWNLCKWFC